ncbi:MAG: hypothetical protein ACM3U1_00710 [Chloroflexota bacterium]
MKNYVKILLIGLVAALGFSACTDDSTSPVDDPSLLNLGAMKATINDSSFYSQQATCYKLGEQLTISAARYLNNSKSKEIISFTLINPDEGSNTASGYFSYTPDLNKPSEVTTWPSSNVSVEITLMTATEVLGRFNFVGDSGSDQKRVTNGTFRVKITG